MFNIRLPSFFSSPTSSSAPHDSTRITLPSVTVHKVEAGTDKPARTLKHLLKANHANHSVIYHSLQFHNHTPHVLGSAYILGGTAEHLNDVYNSETKRLESWHDAPGEISKEDWRDFLGRREYQRAWVDFYEDQLVQYGYDWERLLQDFLYDDDGGKEGPLINGLIEGLGHPLIHLGYALELNSRIVAIEALTLASAFYGDLHKYLDDPKYTRPPPPDATHSTPLELLHRAAGDKRFDGLFKEVGGDNLSQLFAKREDTLLEYWNAWRLDSDARTQFKHSQRAAVAVLVATQHLPSEQKEMPKHDFFFCHLLTTSHAVRILLPLLDARWHGSLARQWWLLTAALYIAQLRPTIKEEKIADVQLDGRDWKWVDHQALAGKWKLDAHFVKACRAMKVAAETWGDTDQFYLKAAVKFAAEFAGWGGFAESDVEARQEIEHS